MPIATRIQIAKPQNHHLLPLVAALILADYSTLLSAPADWTAWQAKRNESIGGTNGWTTLVGLHWLQEGDNSAGRNPSNLVVLRPERVPAFIGVFNRRGQSVSFTAAAGADVRSDGQEVRKVDLQTDASPNPTRLQIGLVSIIAIQRGDRVGLRVRDPNAAARRHFKGLRWFPYDPAWRVEGHFVAFPEERKMQVADVTGGVQVLASPGSIVFSVRGTEYRLDAVQEPDESELFLIFHDETAGDSTYPAGRFLYVPKPDSNGRVMMDFNRAFTPPCGFTEFATCPLPPKQNWLSLAVRAGEVKPEGHH